MSHSCTVHFTLFSFNFYKKLSFMIRVSTVYHMLVKTLEKCQIGSAIIFDSLNILRPM